ncbi:sigma factor-like helix-turn-helix DNA-binding protein [Nocardia thraciensis]
MGEPLPSNALVQVRELFDSLPAGGRELIEMSLFGGMLPAQDVPRMRWMAAELRAAAASANDHADDTESLLARENSVGAFGDGVRETLRVHREGAGRLRDEALLMADQVDGAANDAEKTLCVMYAFGIQLLWQIVRIMAAATAAGPSGQVAAAAVVDSKLAAGRAEIAAMRAGLKHALEKGVAHAAARRSALGPLRLAVTLGKSAALPVGVDAGVQAWQVMRGFRAPVAVGANGENPNGIDTTSILAAGVSGVGGALGGMLTSRFTPKFLPGLANSRLLQGLVNGTAGAISGLGAAALVTGWPENFGQVLAPLLNGGFAGAVHAHPAAHPGSGAAPRTRIDGGGAFTRPDLSEARAASIPAPREGEAALRPAAPLPIEVPAESRRAWESAKTAWRSGMGPAPAGLAPTPPSEAPRRDPAASRPASGVAGRPESPAPAEPPRRDESAARAPAAVPRSVEGGRETSAPPKVSASAPDRPVGTAHEMTAAASEDGSPGDGGRSRSGEQRTDAAAAHAYETPAAGEHGSAANSEKDVAAADSGGGDDSSVPHAEAQAKETLAAFTASSAEQVPEESRLSNLSDDVLQAGLYDLDERMSTVATMELIRRGTVSDDVPDGKVLRPKQLEALYALNTSPVEMKPGEGKSLVFMAAAIQRAVHHDACLLVTTADGLANREFTTYRRMLSGFGIDVLRADQRNGFGQFEGRRAIVVATGETVGHLCNAGKQPPRRVLIDEIDGIIDRGEQTFLQSEGVDLAAPEATAKAVFDAHDFLARGLATPSDKGGLSHEDFGLVRITEKVDVQRSDGTWTVEDKHWYHGRAELTPAGREKVEALRGGNELLKGMGVSRLEMAAAAEFTCRKSVHYVMKAGRIVIVDQREHGLQYNPNTSSESRWSAEKGKASLAQAVEAREIRAAEAAGVSAEQHGIRVRADAESNRRITAAEIYGTDRFFVEVTGASGTLKDLNPVLKNIYGLQEAYEVGRFTAHGLVQGQPEVVQDTRTKLNTIAGYAHEISDGGAGRFQMILCHRNDLVEQQVQALLRKGVPREAIESVDADRIAGWGADWETELQKIFDVAGEQGKILVINRQGQRGVDISVSEAVLADGGMHVWLTEVPEQSYIYEQATNRTARKGEFGTAQALMSPQDALIRNAMHLYGVRETVVHFKQAAEAHEKAPTPENRHKLAEAGGEFGSLVGQLQQRALHHANADFLVRYADKSADPVAALESALTPWQPSDEDTGQPPQNSAARLSALLTTPVSAISGAVAELEQAGEADPLGRLLGQAKLPAAVVEALRQEVDATAPGAAVYNGLLSDEKALELLTDRRDKLALQLGLKSGDIEGAEGMRNVDRALTEARAALATALVNKVPTSDITPATARRIVGEAFTDYLAAVTPSPSADSAAEDPAAEDPAAEDPAAAKVVDAASVYLATAALLARVVEIHRRSPNNCVNNAVTGVRVLTENANLFETLDNNLHGYNRQDIGRIFGAPLEKTTSLEEVAESLKRRPGGISVLVYKWKQTEIQGAIGADDHMVLVVNDSDSLEHPNLVVVDLATSRDGEYETDFGPQDLKNREALLKRAVEFDDWREKQQKFLGKLSSADREFSTIELTGDGSLVSGTYLRDAPAEESLPERPAISLEMEAEFEGKSQPALAKPQGHLERALALIDSFRGPAETAREAKSFVNKCYAQFRQELLDHAGSSETALNINLAAETYVAGLVFDIQRAANETQVALPAILASLEKAEASEPDASKADVSITRLRELAQRLLSPEDLEAPSNTLGEPPDVVPAEPKELIGSRPAADAPGGREGWWGEVAAAVLKPVTGDAKRLVSEGGIPEFRWLTVALGSLAGYFTTTGGVALRSLADEPFADILPLWNRLGELAAEFENRGFGLWHERTMYQLAESMVEHAPILQYRNAYEAEHSVDAQGVCVGISWDVSRAGIMRRGVVEVAQGTARGGVMFADLWNEVGDVVHGIESTWLDDHRDVADNLHNFNEGIRGGLREEDSARATFTGKMAVRRGFTDVVIHYLNGEPGNYDSARLTFVRPTRLREMRCRTLGHRAGARVPEALDRAGWASEIALLRDEVAQERASLSDDALRSGASEAPVILSGKRARVEAQSKIVEELAQRLAEWWGEQDARDRSAVDAVAEDVMRLSGARRVTPNTILLPGPVVVAIAEDGWHDDAVTDMLLHNLELRNELRATGYRIRFLKPVAAQDVSGHTTVRSEELGVVRVEATRQLPGDPRSARHRRLREQVRSQFQSLIAVGASRAVVAEQFLRADWRYRAALAEQWHDLTSPLPGVPARWRNRAYRHWLARDLERLGAARRRLDDSELRRLANLETVDATVAYADLRAGQIPGRPDVYLWAFDPGTGYLVLTLDDTDLVPAAAGIDQHTIGASTVGRIEAEIDRIVDTFAADRRAAPGHSRAAVVVVTGDADSHATARGESDLAEIAATRDFYRAYQHKALGSSADRQALARLLEGDRRDTVSEMLWLVELLAPGHPVRLIGPTAPGFPVGAPGEEIATRVGADWSRVFDRPEDVATHLAGRPGAFTLLAVENPARGYGSGVDLVMVRNDRDGLVQIDLNDVNPNGVEPGATARTALARDWPRFEPDSWAGKWGKGFGIGFGPDGPERPLADGESNGVPGQDFPVGLIGARPSDTGSAYERYWHQIRQRHDDRTRWLGAKFGGPVPTALGTGSTVLVDWAIRQVEDRDRLAELLRLKPGDLVGDPSARQVWAQLDERRMLRTDHGDAGYGLYVDQRLTWTAIAGAYRRVGDDVDLAVDRFAESLQVLESADRIALLAWRLECFAELAGQLRADDMRDDQAGRPGGSAEAVRRRELVRRLESLTAELESHENALDAMNTVELQTVCGRYGLAWSTLRPNQPGRTRFDALLATATSELRAVIGRDPARLSGQELSDYLNSSDDNAVKWAGVLGDLTMVARVTDEAHHHETLIADLTARLDDELTQAFRAPPGSLFDGMTRRVGRELALLHADIMQRQEPRPSVRMVDSTRPGWAGIVDDLDRKLDAARLNALRLAAEFAAESAQHLQHHPDDRQLLEPGPDLLDRLRAAADVRERPADGGRARSLDRLAVRRAECVRWENLFRDLNRQAQRCDAFAGEYRRRPSDRVLRKLTEALAAAVRIGESAPRDESRHEAMRRAVAEFALTRLPGISAPEMPSGSAEWADQWLRVPDESDYRGGLTASEAVELARQQVARTHEWWNGLTDDILPTDLRDPESSADGPGLGYGELRVAVMSQLVLSGTLGAPTNALLNMNEAAALSIRLDPTDPRYELVAELSAAGGASARSPLETLRYADFSAGEFEFILGAVPEESNKVVYLVCDREADPVSAYFDAAAELVKQTHEIMPNSKVSVVAWRRGPTGDSEESSRIRGLLLRQQIIADNHHRHLVNAEMSADITIVAVDSGCYAAGQAVSPEIAGLHTLAMVDPSPHAGVPRDFDEAIYVVSRQESVDSWLRTCAAASLFRVGSPRESRGQAHDRGAANIAHFRELYSERSEWKQLPALVGEADGLPANIRSDINNKTLEHAESSGNHAAAVFREALRQPMAWAREHNLRLRQPMPHILSVDVSNPNSAEMTLAFGELGPEVPLPETEALAAVTQLDQSSETTVLTYVFDDTDDPATLDAQVVAAAARLEWARDHYGADEVALVAHVRIHLSGTDDGTDTSEAMARRLARRLEALQGARGASELRPATIWVEGSPQVDSILTDMIRADEGAPVDEAISPAAHHASRETSRDPLGLEGELQEWEANYRGDLEELDRKLNDAAPGAREYALRQRRVHVENLANGVAAALNRHGMARNRLVEAKAMASAELLYSAVDLGDLQRHNTVVAELVAAGRRAKDLADRLEELYNLHLDLVELEPFHDYVLDADPPLRLDCSDPKTYPMINAMQMMLRGVYGDRSEPFMAQEQVTDSPTVTTEIETSFDNDHDRVIHHDLVSGHEQRMLWLHITDHILGKKNSDGKSLLERIAFLLRHVISHHGKLERLQTVLREGFGYSTWHHPNDPGNSVGSRPAEHGGQSDSSEREDSAVPYGANRKSAEQRRFEHWYRTGNGESEPTQPVTRYVEMHRLEFSQVRRWMKQLGADPAIHDNEPDTPVPLPQVTELGDWPERLRRYLALTPSGMDQLIGAPRGSWSAYERHEKDLAITQLRALLRRVPGLREGYRAYAHHHTQLLANGKPAHPEGYDHLGEYLKFLRTEAGMTLEQVARRVNLSVSSVSKHESGRHLPSRTDVEGYMRVFPPAAGVTYRELVECFPELDVDRLVFPSFRAAESFHEYIRYWRNINGDMSVFKAAERFGVVRRTLIPAEVEARESGAGRPRRPEPLELLGLYDALLVEYPYLPREAGHWNDLAEAWGYEYRMSPDGEPILDPAIYSPSAWVTAVRLGHRMSQSKFAARIGVSLGLIGDIERGRRPPTPRFLTKLGAALDIPDEILAAVLQRLSDQPPSGDNFNGRVGSRPSESGPADAASSLEDRRNIADRVRGREIRLWQELAALLRAHDIDPAEFIAPDSGVWQNWLTQHAETRDDLVRLLGIEFDRGDDEWLHHTARHQARATPEFTATAARFAMSYRVVALVGDIHRLHRWQRVVTELEDDLGAAEAARGPNSPSVRGAREQRLDRYAHQLYLLGRAVENAERDRQSLDPMRRRFLSSLREFDIEPPDRWQGIMGLQVRLRGMLSTEVSKATSGAEAEDRIRRLSFLVAESDMLAAAEETTRRLNADMATWLNHVEGVLTGVPAVDHRLPVEALPSENPDPAYVENVRELSAAVREEIAWQRRRDLVALLDGYGPEFHVDVTRLDAGALGASELLRLTSLRAQEPAGIAGELDGADSREAVAPERFGVVSWADRLDAAIELARGIVAATSRIRRIDTLAGVLDQADRCGRKAKSWTKDLLEEHFRKFPHDRSLRDVDGGIDYRKLVALINSHKTQLRSEGWPVDNDRLSPILAMDQQYQGWCLLRDAWSVAHSWEMWWHGAWRAQIDLARRASDWRAAEDRKLAAHERLRGLDVAADIDLDRLESPAYLSSRLRQALKSLLRAFDSPVPGKLGELDVERELRVAEVAEAVRELFEQVDLNRTQHAYAELCRQLTTIGFAAVRYTHFTNRLDMEVPQAPLGSPTSVEVPPDSSPDTPGVSRDRPGWPGNAFRGDDPFINLQALVDRATGSSPNSRARARSIDEAMEEWYIEAVEQVAEFRTGVPHRSAREMAVTARVLNALVWKLTQRLAEEFSELADSPPASVDPTELRSRYSALHHRARRLRMQADAVCELVRSLPEELPAGSLEPVAGHPAAPEFLDDFPRLLGRVTNALVQPPGAASEFTPSADTMATSAANAATSLTAFIGTNFPGQPRNWFTHVDRYALARVSLRFDHALLRALRSASAAESAQLEASGPVRSGSTMDAAELSDLSLAARFYVTKTSAVEIAMNLVARAASAYESVAQRMTDPASASFSAEVFKKLNEHLAEEISGRTGPEVSVLMRRGGFERLVRDSAAADAFDETIRRLEISDSYEAAREGFVAEALRRLHADPSEASAVREWFTESVYSAYLDGLRSVRAATLYFARSLATLEWQDLIHSFTRGRTMLRARELVRTSHGESLESLIAAKRIEVGEPRGMYLPRDRVPVRVPVHDFYDAYCIVLQAAFEDVRRELGIGQEYIGTENAVFYSEWSRAREFTDAGPEVLEALILRWEGSRATELFGSFHFASSTRRDAKADLFDRSYPALEVVLRAPASLAGPRARFIRELLESDPKLHVLVPAAREIYDRGPTEDLISPLVAGDLKSYPAPAPGVGMDHEAARAVLEVIAAVARATAWKPRPPDSDGPDLPDNLPNGPTGEVGSKPSDSAIGPWAAPAISTPWTRRPTPWSSRPQSRTEVANEGPTGNVGDRPHDERASGEERAARLARLLNRVEPLVFEEGRIFVGDALFVYPMEMRRCIAQLSRRQRVLVVQLFDQGLDVAQVAEFHSGTRDAVIALGRDTFRRLVELLRVELERPTDLSELLARGKALSFDEAMVTIRLAMIDEEAALRNCLDRLGTRQRECIELRVLQDRSRAEVAAVTGTSETNIIIANSAAVRNVIEWLPGELDRPGRLAELLARVEPLDFEDGRIFVEDALIVYEVEMRRCFARLLRTQREFVVQLFDQGLSLAQIAELRGNKLPAVIALGRTTFRRLVELLRAELERPTDLSELLARGEALTLDEAMVAIRLAMIDEETALRHCLDRLGERQRECIELRVLQDRSSAGTAADMGISEANVIYANRLAVRNVVEWLPGELDRRGRVADFLAQTEPLNYKEGRLFVEYGLSAYPMQMRFCFARLPVQERILIGELFDEGLGVPQVAELHGKTVGNFMRVGWITFRRLARLLRSELERPTELSELFAHGKVISAREAAAAVRVVMIAQPDALRRCLDRLPDHQRKYIELHVLQNQSLARTAAAVGETEYSVKGEYARAMRRVIKSLRAEFGRIRAADNDAEGAEGANDNSEAARSPEERRFRKWYRMRTHAAAGSATQSLAQYARMHRLSTEQMRRWSSAIGADIGRYTAEKDTPVPHPREYDDARHWLDAVHTYLALEPEQMDELLEGAPGTWRAIVSSVAQSPQRLPSFAIRQVRALLRRVPDARHLYTPIALRFLPELAEPTHLGTYLRYLRESAGISPQQLAEKIGVPVDAVWRRESGRRYFRSVEWWETYLHALISETAGYVYGRGLGSIGDSLRYLRERVGLTAQQLAIALSEPAEAVIAIETGRSRPTLQMVEAYVQAVTPGVARYPEGHDYLGSYLKYLRVSAGLLCKQLADRVGIAEYLVAAWESGKKPSRGLAPYLRVLPNAASAADVAEVFTFLPRPVLRFPNPYTTLNFDEYLEYFGRLNQLSNRAASRIFGMRGAHGERELVGLSELRVLRAHDEIRDHPGAPSWNDFAGAWGFGYRMDPDGERQPDPEIFAAQLGTDFWINDWMRATRLYHRKSRPEFSLDIGRAARWADGVEQYQYSVTLWAVRAMRDANLISREISIAVIKKYFFRSDFHPAEPRESEKFWNFIAARIGSDEETQIRNDIFLSFRWMLEIAARRWAPRELREDFAQRLFFTMRATIERHAPFHSFAQHLWANCRGAAYLYLLERRFGRKVSGYTDLVLVGKIDYYLYRLGESGTRPPSDTEIARALELTPEQVGWGRQLIAQSTVYLDAPLQDRSGEFGKAGSREIADPAKPPVENDVVVHETLRGLLAELPDSDLVATLVELCQVQGTSVHEAAAEVGIGSERAEQLLEQAGRILRGARDALTNEEEPPVVDDDNDRGRAGDEASADSEHGGHSLNRCGHLTLRLQKSRTGRLDVIVPGEVDRSGLLAMHCAALLHGHGNPDDLTPDELPRGFRIEPTRSHLNLAKAILEAVGNLPPAARNGVSVVVFDQTRTRDRHGVSGHIYRLVYRCDETGNDGRIELQDPGMRRIGPWNARTNVSDLTQIWAMAFDRNGYALPLSGDTDPALRPIFRVGHDAAGSNRCSYKTG